MNEKKQDGITQAFETVGVAFLKSGENLWKSLREAFYGYMNGVMPFHRLAFASMILSTFWLIQFDVTLLRLIHSSVPKFHMNPPVGIFRIILWAMSIVFPFLLWGWRRKNTIEALLKYLQDAFMAAGLQSNGKYPSLIREYITASGSRVLQILSDGVVLSQYAEKKYVLENKLGIEIEAIRQHRQYSRIIEIEFSSGPLEARFDLADTKGFENFTFPVGKTRAETIIGDLTKIPHYLFAGMTGKGKSSFIKMLITVLLSNNKRLQVSFVDLKGTEAPLFNGHPRVRIALDELEALKLIRAADSVIHERKELFRQYKVPDLESFNRKVGDGEKAHRVLLVVDEIAQLTPTLAVHHHAEIKEASLLLNKIARLGRSYGVHLVIGVQKPDSRNLDTTVKANAEGVLCFPVQNQTQSRVALDSNRAMELGGVVGRAVWQIGGDDKIVQTPFLSNEKIAGFIAKERSNGENQQGTTAKSPGGTGSKAVPQETSEDGGAWTELNQ